MCLDSSCRLVQIWLIWNFTSPSSLTCSHLITWQTRCRTAFVGCDHASWCLIFLMCVQDSNTRTARNRQGKAEGWFSWAIYVSSGLNGSWAFQRIASLMLFACHCSYSSYCTPKCESQIVLSVHIVPSNLTRFLQKTDLLSYPVELGPQFIHGKSSKLSVSCHNFPQICQSLPVCLVYSKYWLKHRATVKKISCAYCNCCVKLICLVCSCSLPQQSLSVCSMHNTSLPYSDSMHVRKIVYMSFQAINFLSIRIKKTRLLSNKSCLCIGFSLPCWSSLAVALAQLSLIIWPYLCKQIRYADNEMHNTVKCRPRCSSLVSTVAVPV